MEFYDVLNQVITLLQREGRGTYRALKRQFNLDDEFLDDIKAEIIEAKQLAVDENGRVLVWTRETAAASPPPSLSASALVADQRPLPISYTPPYLTEKILTSRSALEGERKQVTVLFADIKDSTELSKTSTRKLPGNSSTPPSTS
jgi:hypothetical protein